MHTAILLSGGLDSAVLVAEEVARGDVHPIYVHVGLAWEPAELTAVRQFLDRAELGPRVHPLISLSLDMTDVYPAAHWSVEGRPPAYHTPDEDVYLPGRNIVLLSKTAVYCALAGITRLAIGTLAHNPFPDATPAFRNALGSALSLGLGQPIEIVAPYAHTAKAELVRRGHAAGLPLHLTLSCMNPVLAGPAVRHCGLCSKCRERREAFVHAGITDLTDYADTRFTGPVPTP